MILSTVTSKLYPYDIKFAYFECDLLASLHIQILTFNKCNMRNTGNTQNGLTVIFDGEFIILLITAQCLLGYKIFDIIPRMMIICLNIIILLPYSFEV